MSADGAAILVIRGGAIGDFILTLPVLTALRARFAMCRLEVLAYPHIGELALAGGLVDRVHSIEARPLAGFFARGGRLDPGLAEYFRGFALILSYLYDPDRVFETNVGLCTRAQFIAGPHRPDESLRTHAAEVFLRPLERLAIFNAEPVPRLHLRPEVIGGAAEEAPARRRRVAMHPGSGSERKNWPEARWQALIGQLLSTHEVEVLLCGGEAEGERLERLSSRFRGAPLEVARSLPLVELARRLHRCCAFVGHDSGITHLASALGLPGIVLWGPSPEAIWRPNGAGMTLLRAEGGLACLSVSTVASALDDLLALDPQA